MKTKILIAILTLFLLTGIAVAKDVNDFKVPMEFTEKVNDGTYQVPGSSDHAEFIILKVKDTSEFDHNESGYTIFPTGETENTYYYLDTELNEQGCVELVEVDGEKYLIFSQYGSGVKNPGYLGAALLAIQDFNKDNNVKPVPMI